MERFQKNLKLRYQQLAAFTIVFLNQFASNLKEYQELWDLSQRAINDERNIRIFNFTVPL